MSKRAYNFNAGPAALPLEVLIEAQKQFVEYEGIGMSIMEISHRSKEYEQLNDETQQLLRELLNIPEGYHILFLQGGASSQFALIPMNFVKEGQQAAYVMTGSWASKAHAEAKILGKQTIELTAEDSYELPAHTAYVHLTSNETIAGAQFKVFPNTGDIPLIADMSSDILSREIDVSQFAMIYAGAQKNLGPSGVTIAIIRDDLLAGAVSDLPTMFSYATHVNNNSLYNTPPVYSVYMVNLVLKWIKSLGGLAEMEKRNIEKAALIYDEIDRSNGFYYGTVDSNVRSLMNITFRLRDEQLEQAFIKQAAEHGFVGLKGHRSVGGLRASTYNAVPRESCEALAAFMADFRAKNA